MSEHRREVLNRGAGALVLIILALGFVRQRTSLPARLALPFVAAGYVALLAASISLLAHIARAVSAERTRTTFLLLVFVPHVVHGLIPQVPSLPWVLDALLDGMAALGGPAR